MYFIRWYYFYLGVVLVIAVYTDVKYEKIYNGLIAVGFMGIIIKLVVDFSWQHLYYTMAGVVLPVVCLFPLFYFRMMGAGDIKLLAVIGGFLEFKGILNCLILSVFIGAVIAVYKMYRHNLFHERFAYFSYYMKNYLKTKDTVPYYSNLSGNAKIHFAIPVGIAVAIHYVCVWGGMFI